MTSIIRPLEGAKTNSSVMPSEDIAVFTPPSGWFSADQSSIQLPPKVKIMVIGKGSYALPPSMNLSLEPYQGSLKEYLKIVKNMNDEKGYAWKDLGIIQTQSGPASLSQVDTKSQWGDNRQMHAILLKNGTIYILTASAMKDEFSLFYQDFFKAMKSLRITSDFYDIIPNPTQKNELKKNIEKLKKDLDLFVQQPDSSMNFYESIEKAFKSPSFQSQYWQPFLTNLTQNYSDLGFEWQKMVEKKVQDDLLALSEQNQNYSKTKIKLTQK